MERWFCGKCGAFRHRADVEHGAEAVTSWICRACGARGAFVPESSEMGAVLARKLSVETYHDKLEAAGYSLEWPQTPLTRGRATASKGLQKLLHRIGGWFRKY